MPNSIFPAIEPLFFFLHHNMSTRHTSCHIRIGPYTFHDLVFLRASEDLRYAAEETIDFVRRVDNNFGVCEREGDVDFAGVGGAIYEGEEAHFEVCRVPIRYLAGECEAISLC